MLNWTDFCVRKQHAEKNNKRFTALCPQLPRWVSARRSIHSLRPIWPAAIIYQLPSSTKIHSIFPVQFTCLTVFLHNPSPSLPLGLEHYTSYSIHFFTQSLSSFCNTCYPYPHKKEDKQMSQITALLLEHCITISEVDRSYVFTTVWVTGLCFTRRLLQPELATDASNLFAQQLHLMWLHS